MVGIMRWTLFIAVFCFCMVAFLTPAAAGSNDDFWDEQLNKVVTDRLDYEQQLMSTPEAEWTKDNINGYLYNAMMNVYLATAFYLWDNRAHPVSLEAAFTDAKFGGWPGNPFNDWEPMEVVGVGEEFVPGGLALQLAPSDYWSYMDRDAAGNYIAGPYNFELAVFGPDTDYAEFSDARPYAKNEAWAVIPKGALYMIGAWKETTVLTDEKRECRRRAAEDGQ